MSGNQKQEARPSNNGHSAQVTYEALRKEIKGFCGLEKGWDSHGAGAPSNEAISNALRVLDEPEQMELDVTPEWAVPTGDESLRPQYLIGDTIYHWQFDSDGDMALMEKVAGGEPSYLDVDPAKIPEVLQGFTHGRTE
jgi:hypothetical protein